MTGFNNFRDFPAEESKFLNKVFNATLKKIGQAFTVGQLADLRMAFIAGYLAGTKGVTKDEQTGKFKLMEQQSGNHDG